MAKRDTKPVDDHGEQTSTAASFFQASGVSAQCEPLGLSKLPHFNYFLHILTRLLPFFFLSFFFFLFKHWPTFVCCTQEVDTVVTRLLPLLPTKLLSVFARFWNEYLVWQSCSGKSSRPGNNFTSIEKLKKVLFFLIRNSMAFPLQI